MCTVCTVPHMYKDLKKQQLKQATVLTVADISGPALGALARERVDGVSAGAAIHARRRGALVNVG